MRERKSLGFVCEDQKIDVILPFLLKILQEGRRKKEEARASSAKLFEVCN